MKSFIPLIFINTKKTELINDLHTQLERIKHFMIISKENEVMITLYHTEDNTKKLLPYCTLFSQHFLCVPNCNNNKSDKSKIRRKKKRDEENK